MKHINSSPVRIAAFDFGSNSFHMAVAEISNGRCEMLLRQGERVQLAAGIRGRELDTEAIHRALDCVQRFADQVRPLQPQAVRAVTTHAARIVDNAAQFLVPARLLLQHPIDVISGEEEARLIYRAVGAEFLHQPYRLVIDIGGGSTELVLGQGNDIKHCDSLDLGCLTLKERFFDGGDFKPAQFARAVEHAVALLAPLAARYTPHAGMHIGTSGTLQAVAGVLQQHFGHAADCITQQALLAVPRELARAGQSGVLALLKGLDAQRRPVFVSGLAIITALFLQLGIQRLQIAQSDLRDGVLLDLIQQLGLDAPAGLAENQTQAHNSELARSNFSAATLTGL
jgi:exopolyphosphatase / guanosine-5'-triphosphate,3'-diphosphate pyrophosphatase